MEWEWIFAWSKMGSLMVFTVFHVSENGLMNDYTFEIE